MKLRNVYETNSDEERIEIIAKLVYEGSISPKIREVTHKVLNNAGLFYGMEDMNNINVQWEELRTIFLWVRDNFAYRNDPYKTDAYHTAERILELGAYDCDDATILLDSMLASIGWRVGARIVSVSLDRPFHHIYSIVVFPKHEPLHSAKLVPMDPTIKYFDVGDQVRFAKKRDFLFL